MEGEHLDVAAESLQQLLDFSGEPSELLLLLQRTRDRLTGSTQLQVEEDEELLRQESWEAASAAAAAAEVEKELSHGLHLALLLQAAADSSTGRCCCMRLLLPPESLNYDFGVRCVPAGAAAVLGRCLCCC